MIKRKAYTRHTPSGIVHVRDSWIPKQGSLAPRKRARTHASPRIKCPAGQVARSGYARKSSSATRGDTKYRVGKTHVPAICIRDIGRQGKGSPKIQRVYKLRKGALTQYDYHINESAADRHAALKRAIAAGMPINSLIWKLNAQAVLRKNAEPGSDRARAGQRFAADVEWAREQK